MQYISRNQTAKDCEPFEKEERSRGIMVWAAQITRGRPKLRFIDQKCKVNSEVYQTQVLRPFLKEDLPKLGGKDAIVFHQDSAPAHRSKSTQQYLMDNEINFIPPDKWMPNSPNAAPCDYFLWGYLKAKMRSFEVKTIRGLKSALQQAYKKIPDSMIEKSMRAWPKRCRQIHYAKGLDIENKL